MSFSLSIKNFGDSVRLTVILLYGNCEWIVYHVFFFVGSQKG